MNTFLAVPIGFPAIYHDAVEGDITGFMVTGHVYVDGTLPKHTNVGALVKAPGLTSELGTVTSVHRGGPVDAAFVEATAGQTFSKYTPSGVEIVGSDNYNYPVNTYICKEGATTNKTCGYILNNNYNLTTADGTYMYNVVITDYYSQGGDSGAVVYVPYLMPDGYYDGLLIGMHFAGYLDYSFDYGYYCKYSNISSYLNIDYYYD